jgi:ATP adenylyltransferase/5',5'''-P-1,P-4-tetraphosphate phosphorylase II
MKSLMQQALELWNEQVANWPLAAQFYGSLPQVLTREFVYDHTRVLVQFNPARVHSTTAKTDAGSIAKRPCFLCSANRPAEQREVDAGDFLILVNPFPIFQQHFTIPHKQHLPQQLLPYYIDFLQFAKELHEFVVFYNGPRCGASAPDHLHFQAGNKGFLPLIDDFNRNRHTLSTLYQSIEGAQLLRFKGVLRKVWVIEAESAGASHELFVRLYNSLPALPGEEPMMNVLVLYENKKWVTFVLPREVFRPRQYFAEATGQLLISPAAIEMAGVLITPVEEHYNKITRDDIPDLFHQISPDMP